MKASVREWGETSSCHGIPHMAGASTLFAAAIWCVILVICAIIFVYLFSDTLRQYLRFDKIVKLNVRSRNSWISLVQILSMRPFRSFCCLIFLVSCNFLVLESSFKNLLFFFFRLLILTHLLSRSLPLSFTS